MSSARFGNPIRTQTILGTRKEGPPPPKRQKMAIPNTATITRGNRAPRRESGKLPPIINVDDDEDMGVVMPRPDAQPSSPDPLTLLSSSDNTRRLHSTNGLHPFETTDTQSVENMRERHQGRKRKPSPNSEVTMVLDSEGEDPPIDEIDDFSDEVKAGPSKPAVLRHTVKKMVSDIEGKGKLVPHVDLRGARSVARNMRPRNAFV